MNNDMFQKGSFDGFDIHGRCRVVKKFTHQLENSANRIKKPGSGKYMAILDDPRLISDPDAIRLPDDQVSDKYSEKTPVVFIEKDSRGGAKPKYLISMAGLSTGSLDGALIEFEKKLKFGDRLILRWDFLIGEHGDNAFALNDFALVEILDANDGTVKCRHVLCQTLDIPDDRWSTGWRSFTWSSSDDFKSRIRIVVCNGYSFIDSNPPTLEQLRVARSFPSGLLLDSVCVCSGGIR